jgi:3-deoxy-D-manno-octulosonic-acid transferase
MIKGLFNPGDSGYPEPHDIPNGDPLDVYSLLVDRMGLLSMIYRYGDIAYIGGGFGSGIHNTLEAAAHGVPVLFGPNHQRFAEAQGLIESGAGWCINDANQLQSMLQQMSDDPDGIKTAGANAKRYVEKNAGATERIVSVLKLRH